MDRNPELGIAGQAGKSLRHDANYAVPDTANGQALIEHVFPRPEARPPERIAHERNRVVATDSILVRCVGPTTRWSHAEDVEVSGAGGLAGDAFGARFE